MLIAVPTIELTDNVVAATLLIFMLVCAFLIAVMQTMQAHRDEEWQESADNQRRVHAAWRKQLVYELLVRVYPHGINVPIFVIGRNTDEGPAIEIFDPGADNAGEIAKSLDEEIFDFGFLESCGGNPLFVYLVSRDPRSRSGFMIETEYTNDHIANAVHNVLAGVRWDELASSDLVLTDRCPTHMSA